VRESLIDRAQALAARLSHMGVQHDLAALALADVWGLMWFLERLARGGGHGPAS
jgi:hypothetical protein